MEYHDRPEQTADARACLITEIHLGCFLRASPLSLSLCAPRFVLFFYMSLCVCFRRRIAHYGAVHQLGAWTGHHRVRTVYRRQRRAAVEDDVEQHEGRRRPLRQGRRSRNRGDENKRIVLR